MTCSRKTISCSLKKYCFISSHPHCGGFDHCSDSKCAARQRQTREWQSRPRPFFHFKRHRCTEPVMWLIRKYQGLWRYGVRAKACPTASGAGNVLFVPHSIRSWPFASECSKPGGGGDDEAGRKKEGRKVEGVEKHDWTKSSDSHTCQ